jgi:hypothetical protein
MDTDEIIAHSRARFDHAAARRTLRERYQARMVFGHRGGMFRAAPDMITLLSMYGDQDIVIQDLYENPVQVNASELLDIMRGRWQEQMTAWLIEHDQLNQQR